MAWMLSLLPALSFDAYLQVSSANNTPVAADTTHGWVEVLGFSQGTEASVSLTGVPGKPMPRSCTLQLAQDRIVANLMSALCAGQRRNLIIQVPQRLSQEVTVYTELQFKDCLITKVETSLDENQPSPIFGIGLVYSQLLWTVTVPNSSGDQYVAVGSGFDFPKAQPINRGAITPPSPGAYADGGSSGGDGDLDDDGIPDAWETANGLNPNNAEDASGDKDQDGFSNRDEYIAGTNPNSPTSFLRATVNGLGSPSSDSLTLGWNSVAGKVYTILATQDLTQPFLPIATVTAGSGNQSSYTTSKASGRFFKIRVTE